MRRLSNSANYWDLFRSGWDPTRFNPCDFWNQQHWKVCCTINRLIHIFNIGCYIMDFFFFFCPLGYHKSLYWNAFSPEVVALTSLVVQQTSTHASCPAGHTAAWRRWRWIQKSSSWASLPADIGTYECGASLSPQTLYLDRKSSQGHSSIKGYDMWSVLF